MWLDDASEIDILFYQPYAKFVANTICEKDNTPLTVGFFGKWGAGKSTLVNLVKAELGNKENNIVIDTNAWLFEGYTDAKTSLMETITRGLHANQKVSARAKSKCIELFKRIDKIKIAKSIVGIGASLVSLLSTGNPLSASATVESAKEMVDAVTGDEIKETNVSNIADFRREFAELLKALDEKTVIIVIDDLDRCSPERIIDTLEAIKLFLSVEGAVFLIAADDTIIKYAIANKYPKLMEQDERYSTEYIEKIIQVPITIPSLSAKDVENYLLLLVAQKYLKNEKFSQLIATIQDKKLHIRDSSLSYSELLELVSALTPQPYKSLQNGHKDFERDCKTIDGIKETVARTLNGNPRQTKRFLNTFMTKKGLAELYYPGEIDDAILAKMLALYQIAPRLFRQLYEWNNQFDGHIPHLREALEEQGTEDNKEWQSINIEKWKVCPPANLHETPLDRYFYLTRENLEIQNVAPVLSTEAKNILGRLTKATGGTIDRIFSDLKGLPQQDQEGVVDTYLSKITGSANDWNVVSSILESYPSKAENVVNRIKDTKITIAAEPFFRKLHGSHNEIFNELLQKISDSKARQVIEKAKQ